MPKDSEKIELSFDEMDLVFLSLKDRAVEIAKLEDKAKKMSLSKTEKAALSESSKVKDLMTRFLTPARQQAEELEVENEEGLE